MKEAKEIVKRKNVDIAALKKKLKLPSTKDPQTKEVGEIKKEKEDMFKIIIEQNGQIKDMEVEMERLLKEKEKFSQLAIVPLTTVPILVATIARVSTSTTIEPQTTNSSNELVKAIEDLSIIG